MTLGRRSLPRVAWVLVAIALFDFLARSIMAANPIDESAALDPTRAVAGVAAAGLMLLDAAVFAMVSLLLLPLLDGLVRGISIGVARAASSVARKTIPLTVSSVVQGVILAVPLTVLLVSAVAPVVRPVLDSGGVSQPGILQALLRTALWRAFWPALAWTAVVSLLFVFAFPFVILENRGPIRSIGLSASLLVRSLRREWGRIAGVLVLWLCLAAIVWLPQAPLRSAFGLTSGARVGASLASAWGAAASALALLWCDAGLIALFRKLVPARA
ncbi:MAG: hypothetical protein ACRENN_02155 [Candidatus Eiseniibacteriota bacterium]